LLGYALLIPYWSNEFGGVLLFVDELFVLREVRNRGIGHSFFRFLTPKTGHLTPWHLASK
jgi:hypothetical protein